MTERARGGKVFVGGDGGVMVTGHRPRRQQSDVAEHVTRLRARARFVRPKGGKEGRGIWIWNRRCVNGAA